jgi:hypothetical protein
MTPTELRSVASAFGKPRYADDLGWTVRTLDRKLSGQHKITKTDELAVRRVVGRLVSEANNHLGSMCLGARSR